MEAQGYQLGFGILEGGKNFIPNLISDLEPGPRTPFWLHHRDGGEKMRNVTAKQAALSSLWPSASKERYAAHS